MNLSKFSGVGCGPFAAILYFSVGATGALISIAEAVL